MQRVIGILATLAVICLIPSSATAAEADFGKGDAPFRFSLYPAHTADQTQVMHNTSSSNAQAPVSLPRVSPVQVKPMTADEKWRYYLKSTFGPGSFGYTAFAAGIKQANGSPEEWGGGMEGYGKRYASAFGNKLIDRSLRFGLQTWWHEHPRYVHSSHSGLWPRTWDAVSQSFRVYKDNGGTRVAYSRFIAHFSAAYVSRQWHPDRYHDTSHYLSAGFTSIGIDAGKNVLTEFWPDIKRRLPF